MTDLIRHGSLSPEVARFLEHAVAIRKNIVIAGGISSGKTTLLNALCASIPPDERIITIEATAELRLLQPHVVSLEAGTTDSDKKGTYSTRDLINSAVRMRPDRIVLGDCLGAEAIELLQAMNVGHEGFLTTTYANSPREAIARLETLCLTAGLVLPLIAIRRQLAASIHLVVQQARYSDGSRRVANVCEVVGLGEEGEIELCEIGDQIGTSALGNW
jgi:pilus assembly protein CpaF